MLSQVFSACRRYPLVPSMLTYSVLYPGANILQQVYFRDRKPGQGVDWQEASRYLDISV